MVEGFPRISTEPTAFQLPQCASRNKEHIKEIPNCRQNERLKQKKKKSQT